MMEDAEESSLVTSQTELTDYPKKYVSIFMRRPMLSKCFKCYVPNV